VLTPSLVHGGAATPVIVVRALDRLGIVERRVVELGRLPRWTGHGQSVVPFRDGPLWNGRTCVRRPSGATLAPVRKVALAVGALALALAGVLSASVLAGPTPQGVVTDTTTTTVTEPTTTSTTTPTETTSPPPPPAPKPKPKPKPKPAPKPQLTARLPKRVAVGGVYVGGLSRKAALAAVNVAFRSPLAVTVDDTRVTVSPARLGARAYVEGAIARAMKAKPGARIPLKVTVSGAAVRSWVVGLSSRFDREVADARVVLKELRPTIVPERSGFELKREKTVAAVVDALRATKRGPVKAAATIVPPQLRERFFDSVVVIRRDSKELRYYKGEKLARVFKVATGQSAYPTPLGTFRIVQMSRNPWWYPPPSPWAQGAKPVPPGPGNPLGTRWMGISSPAVGIHGTPDAASLGYSASHGCIRMAIPSAEWLFEHVKVGTPVFIVGA
jgi:lipoprotein-anchoring transpeptidase ErfK/SrfK